MKKYTYPIAAGLLLAALTLSPPRSAADTWNNASTDFLWNTTSANWTSPAIWNNGDDAIFGATGAGTIGVNTNVTVQSITVSGADYTFSASPSSFGVFTNTLSFYTNGLNPITPSINNNVNLTIAATILGTNGLTFTGTGTNVLQGDTSFGVANQYTGGTYVRSGTLVLACPNVASSGASYAVDSIEALDTGATLRFGTFFNGSTYSSPQNFIAANVTSPFVPHLIMTGGTLDLNNDPKTQRIPCPDGFGTIINNGSSAQSGLQIVMDGLPHTFSGVIADGGPILAPPTGQGPGYQIGIVNISGGPGDAEWTLSGANTYSGSTRLGNGSIKLSGAGTLGVPSAITGVTGPLRVYGPHHLDLNGTSQTIGVMTDGNSGGMVYNTAVDTVSTLSFGFGPNNNTCTFQFMDNPGTGGVLAMTKIGTGQQQIKGVCTYSGDTTVSSGVLVLGDGASSVAVSPNTHIRLSTSGGTLQLAYSGDVVVRGLYINGVRMPAGTYGNTTAPITGTGTITVPPPNIWNNASTDFQWNATSANWTSPTTWVDGADAAFGATGAGAISISTPVAAHNLTFSADGYSLAAVPGTKFTLMDSNATITVNSSVSVAATIIGTNGLTVQGTTNLTLLGDAGFGVANQYTGGTYVKSGTLILKTVGNDAGGGTAYAVDSIEQVDAGATVQIGTVNDGLTNIKPPDGQIRRGASFGRLNLTGGTFDDNGNDNNHSYPPPSGTGTIVNSSPYIRAVMKLSRNDGSTFVFNGQITDGGPNVTTSQGVAHQQNIDMNGGNYTLILGGSNSFTGFLRMNSGPTGNTIILTNSGTLGYPAPINCPSRQILMNSGRINLNGTSQKVGYVYTGNDANSVITNGAHGTTSTLTVCLNCTNLVAFNGAATPRGIRCALLDDPTTGGTLALTKEGVAIQPIGDYAADGGSALPNNYHGDTTVNNGILEVSSAGGVSPNSAYRLNTTLGKLQLDYAGTANVRQLWINGVQQANGIYGAGSTTAITGAGTITVTGATARPTLGVSRTGNTFSFSWAGSFRLQSQTNSATVGLRTNWFDYPGGGTSPVNVTIDRTKGCVFFRLSN